MTEKRCCFCFNIILEGNIVDEEILELLKFLIVNVNTSTLKNSTVCDGCLIKIIETCEYKRNSIKKLMETTKELDPEKLIMCQKCEKVCEQGDYFPLEDCVTQIRWLDFINYLFIGQDSQSLKSLQICDSCRISVTHIQDFLKLIYVYDQNKIKYDIDNHDTKATVNKNLVEDKVEIKQEYESFILTDKTGIENIIEDNKTEIGDSGCLSYADCKNEEVELKLDYDHADDNHYFDRCRQADGQEMTSTGNSDKNNFNNDEEESVIVVQESSNRKNRKHCVKVENSNIQCTLCSKSFAQKQYLDDHLLKIHKSKENVTSKIHKCDKCSYETTYTNLLLRHTLKHSKKRFEKYTCQHCSYKTSDKKCLNNHIKMHNNIQDFECPKKFIRRRELDNRLLKVHKRKDNVTHKCDKCSYETTIKSYFLKHRLKHCIKEEGLEKCNWQHCNYETYDKHSLIRHMKVHCNIRYYTCTFCSKNFAQKQYLDDHLLRIHKSKDSVTSKIHKCDKCNYETTYTNLLLRHALKHGKNVEGFEKYTCQHCSYETSVKTYLITHMEIHSIRNFKCIFCSNKFCRKRQLNNHLLRVHKNEDHVTCKIHKCDKCSYETITKNMFLKHKLKHGIQVEGLEYYKCQHCSYKTYNRSHLTRHMNMHYNIRVECTFCSNKFRERRYLDDHLLKVHKNKDNVICKIHKCDECSYETTFKDRLLKHKLKHGVKVEGFEKCKCHLCNYETYDKQYLIRHMKMHYNIRDFECTFCSKKFTERRVLDNHLLKVHRSKDNITGKIYKCDECNFETTIKSQLMRHDLIHDKK